MSTFLHSFSCGIPGDRLNNSLAKNEEQEGESGDYARLKNRTLLLLHGLGRTSRSMKKSETFFRKYYKRVISLGYPSTSISLDEIVEDYLRSVIDREGENIDFFTHSMGGIILRYYLQDHPMPKSRAVMLAPPNKGSEVIDFFKSNRVLEKIAESILGPAGMSLHTGLDSTPCELKKVDIELGVIAGSYSNILLGDRFFNKKNDGKVTVESAKLPEMIDFYEVDCSHTFIMNKREVLQASLNFLEYGKFRIAGIKQGESQCP